MGMGERQVWINGRMMPESQGFISFRDLGIIYGEGVFDTARTFGGRMFRLSDHIDRLYDSLAYARINPGMTKGEMTAATELLLEANLPVLRPGEDYWVTQRVTAGIRALDGEPLTATGPTVMIECSPLPLRARARYFRDGIDAVVAKRPKIAPDALSPRAKTTNYLNMMLAQAEVADAVPGAWAIQPDVNGNLAEGPGNNVFFVKGGVVHTPSDDYVLGGVSRQVVLDICGTHQIPLVIGDVTPAMAAASDEAFFTSTSLCACPVRSLNGAALPGGVPGPVTRRIMDAFAAEAGFDFVAQYLAFLSDAPAQGGI
jgi:branched-chain amino acid aminotransferase